MALEASLLHDEGEGVIGLLTEAAQLAPDDPHVAYWYASSLADAGHGTAAREVLEPRRDEIAKAFPGMVDKLAARIDRRIQLEVLPHGLIQRIDAFNEAKADGFPLNSRERWMMAVFRVVDQNDKAIDASAFSISDPGYQGTTESFDDGYFLFAYKDQGNNSGQACRLKIAQPGLKSKEFQFSSVPRDVIDVHRFVVHRYNEGDKVPFLARIVSSDGEPLVDANINLRPVQNRGGNSDSLSTKSGADGRGKLLNYPMQYSYQVSAEDYKDESGQVTLEAANPDEVTVTLYPLVKATVRVTWASTAANLNGELDAGETVLETAAPNQNAQVLQWLRLVQVKDQLSLHVQSQFFGRPDQAATWVRIVEADQNADIAPLLVYKNLELYDIDGLKDELPPPVNQQPGMARGQQPVVLQAERGKVYVGKVSQMDRRTGQPMQLAFKAIVEEMQVASDE